VQRFNVQFKSWLNQLRWKEKNKTKNRGAIISRNGHKSPKNPSEKIGI